MALGDTPYRLMPSCETLQCLTGKIDNNNFTLYLAPPGWPTECGVWPEFGWPAGSVPPWSGFLNNLIASYPDRFPLALGDTPYRLMPSCEILRCLTGKIDNNIMDMLI